MITGFKQQMKFLTKNGDALAMAWGSTGSSSKGEWVVTYSAAGVQYETKSYWLGLAIAEISAQVEAKAAA
jgi:hypothetical protein